MCKGMMVEGNSRTDGGKSLPPATVHGNYLNRGGKGKTMLVLLSFNWSPWQLQFFQVLQSNKPKQSSHNFFPQDNQLKYATFQFHETGANKHTFVHPPGSRKPRKCIFILLSTHRNKLASFHFTGGKFSFHRWQLTRSVPASTRTTHGRR